MAESLTSTTIAVEFRGTFTIAGPDEPPTEVQALPPDTQLELFRALAQHVAMAAAAMTYTQHKNERQAEITHALHTRLRALAQMHDIDPTALQQWANGMRVSDVEGTWDVAQNV